MFVAMSRFAVANGKAAEVRQAFRERPRRVEQAPGFLRMEVLSPAERPEEFWLITHWRDRESYERWHASHDYHESHAGIPKGLKLVRGETEIRFLELITE